MKKPLVELLLDSGAFSAWRTNQFIDLKSYIQFIKDHKPYIRDYVNLDVIPGVYGSKRTQKQVEDSAKQSYKNQQIMKDAGLTPIPVFHQGEAWSWLEKLLKDGEPYIGVSAFKDVPLQSQRKWLDECFTIMTNEKGQPYCRTHGFAITNHPLVIRYPWYTVDSTTWSLGAGYGHILVPPLVGGKFDYAQRPMTIVMSGINRKTQQSKQFEGFIHRGSKFYADALKKFLEEEVGITEAEARYDTGARRKAILTYYMKLVENTDCPLFLDRRQGIGHKLANIKIPKKNWHAEIMFATSLKNKTWGKELTEAGANTRLLSYFELQDNVPEALEHYVMTGMAGDFKKKPKPRKERKKPIKRERTNRAHMFTEEQIRRMVLESYKDNVDIDQLVENLRITKAQLNTWRRQDPTFGIKSDWRSEGYLNRRRLAMAKKINQAGEASK